MKFTRLTVVLAAGLLLSGLSGTAGAQGYVVPGTTGPSLATPPGGTWGGYPTYNPWDGYRPGLPWAGYAPPAATIPPPVVATPPTATRPPSYVTAPAPTPVYVSPAPRFAATTIRTTTTTRQPYFPGTRLMVAPSYYREYGTGRNVYQAKPWLPNQ